MESISFDASTAETAGRTLTNRGGYLYLKGNSYNYCCHYCNHRGSLKGVLRDLGSELLKENPKQTQTLRSSTKPSTISRKESFTVK